MSTQKTKTTKPLRVNSFNGFPREAIRFMKSLKRNNNRIWFEKHKPEYLEHIVMPSRALIESLRAPIRDLSPHISVTPRSMYRIYRDTRFSGDKTPYKTWVGYNFKDLRGNTVVPPSYYLGWDPSGIAYGAGIYSFTTTEREIFRARVTEGDSARRFQEIITQLKRSKRFEIMGSALKRMPVGYDLEHPNAEFLRFNSCYIVYEEDFPAVFYSSRFPDRVMKLYREAAPFMRWITEFSQSLPRNMSQRSRSSPD